MSTSSWTPEPTADGSFTFFSPAFGETFHSRQGAQAEAEQKFVSATDLRERAHQPQLRLLDVCYGLGYNTAAALSAIWQVNPHCQVTVMALELDATVPLAAIAPPLLAQWSPLIQAVLTDLAQHHRCHTPHLDATLHLGDARQTIQPLARSGWQANAIFLDPFSPRRCPQLWTVEFLGLVAQCLAPNGKLATYSRSAAVRAALQAVGLQLGTLPLGPQHKAHDWAQGTVAAWSSDTLHPLSPMEREHLQTRAAIPLRDRTLTDPAHTILARQQAEQQTCQRESTSSWRRRWGIV